jgi:hypothetical protein
MPEWRATKVRFRLTAIALLSTIMVIIIAAADLFAARNLVLNGDLSKGSGNSPDHWRAEGWDQKPDTTTYTWSFQPGSPGELLVNSRTANDAR